MITNTGDPRSVQEDGGQYITVHEGSGCPGAHEHCRRLLFKYYLAFHSLYGGGIWHNNRRDTWILRRAARWFFLAELPPTPWNSFFRAWPHWYGNTQMNSRSMNSLVRKFPVECVELLTWNFITQISSQRGHDQASWHRPNLQETSAAGVFSLLNNWIVQTIQLHQETQHWPPTSPS